MLISSPPPSLLKQSISLSNDLELIKQALIKNSREDKRGRIVMETLKLIKLPNYW